MKGQCHVAYALAACRHGDHNDALAYHCSPEAASPTRQPGTSIGSRWRQSRRHTGSSGHNFKLQGVVSGHNFKLAFQTVATSFRVDFRFKLRSRTVYNFVAKLVLLEEWPPNSSTLFLADLKIGCTVVQRAVVLRPDFPFAALAARKRESGPLGHTKACLDGQIFFNQPATKVQPWLTTARSNIPSSAYDVAM
jgi:hypothetical protein